MDLVILFPSSVISNPKGAGLWFPFSFEESFHKLILKVCAFENAYCEAFRFEGKRDVETADAKISELCP